MNDLVVFRDSIFKKHVNSPMHPESPERLKAIDRAIDNHELKERIIDMEVREAGVDELLWVHSESHIDLNADSVNRPHPDFDYETAGNSHSYGAARRAAGPRRERRRDTADSSPPSSAAAPRETAAGARSSA